MGSGEVGAASLSSFQTKSSSSISVHSSTARMMAFLYNSFIFSLTFSRPSVNMGAGEAGHRAPFSLCPSCQRRYRWQLILFSDILDAIKYILGFHAVGS